MTDTLRDRIAALLELLRPVTPAEAAEAVIRELGLTKITDVNRSVPRSRYVTPWSYDTNT